MDSAGARLKKIRLEKGLTLEDAHKKTKIHLNILKAIEEDELAGINPIYLKGFLKIYCVFLGEDPKDYAGGYQQSQPPVKEAAVKKDSLIPVFKKPSLSLSPLKKFKINKRIIVRLFLIALLISIVSTIKISCKRKVHPGTLKASSQVLRSALKPAAAVRANPAPKVKKPVQKNTAVSEDTVTPKSINAQLRLGMRAKENSWVHLAVDGKVAFHGILKKGKFESWIGKDKIEFSLSNAQAIELELNDRIIPPLGRKGQAVKNVVVTKEGGISVGR